MIEENLKAFDEAIRSIDASFWEKAIYIVSNSTWELVGLLLGLNTIYSKWISKQKLRLDGTIESFNVRLVIRWFTQKTWP